jgi:hypothetical protein
LYSTMDIVMVKESRNVRWKGHVSRFSQMANEYRTSVGKVERKKLIGRRRRRRKCHIKCHLKE